MHQLILASQSPRRRELLEKEGFLFAVDTLKVSELINKNLNLETAIATVAQDKAKALVETGKYPKGRGILILSADTVVVLGEDVLGKPADAEQAKEFLRRLSGAEHRVISGICVYDVDSCRYFLEADTTFVRFKSLTESEISEYVESGEPLDRAGAYAIQGGGASFVEERRGSWSNVVGLPLELFERMIVQHGWKLARRKSG